MDEKEGKKKGMEKRVGGGGGKWKEKKAKK